MTSTVRSEATRSRRPLDVIRAYVGLTKPRIIELLLVTTVPAMLLAARGLPPVGVVVATLVGGILSAGSANAFNCYFDRDIDAVMRRTRNRPLAKHQVSDRAALVFGFALAVVSTAILWFGTTWLAAVLAVATIAFYVCVYTLLLKRRTSQNIIWGGAAGCMPVMIGWAAVTGSLAWAPVALFAVIFFWTPPHSWALAMRYREDYAAAGVPMLPVVKPARVVTRWMVVHAWLMVASSVALWPLATSWVYGVSAVLFGAWFLLETHLLHAATVRGTQTKPIRVFHLSNTYLTLLFLAVAVDALLGL